MSKINDMIKELCPEGVEKIKIKDAFKRLKGTPITAGIMKDIEDIEGNVTIFAGGKTIIKTFEKDIPNANIINVPVVIVQSRGVIDVQFCDSPCTFKNEMWAYTSNDSTSVLYLFYYLKQNIEILRRKGSEHGSMPQISLSATENYEIPLPPLAIQQEIVSVLDSFTTLIDKMKQEVEMRKKQMEYYREKLLTFEEGECEWKTLGEISIDIYSGATPSTKIKEYWEGGTIPWMSSGEVHQGQVFSIEGKITELGYSKCSTRMVPVDSIVIALAGQGKTRGTVAITRIDLCTNQSLAAIVPNKELVSPDYLYYYLKGEYMNLRTVSSGDGTRGGLNLRKINEYRIPLVNLDRQSEIVSILVKFESYITKLERMISLRQKQYEYYREKLLTFE